MEVERDMNEGERFQKRGGFLNVVKTLPVPSGDLDGGVYPPIPISSRLGHTTKLRRQPRILLSHADRVTQSNLPVKKMAPDTSY